MKTILTLAAIFLALASFAQTKAVVEQDTIKYKGQKYYVGKEFQVAQGSGDGKTFQWIFVTDDKYRNVKPLYNVYANTKLTVDSIYNTHRGWSVQTHLPNRTRTTDGKVLKGELVFFVVEKAVENKEVVIE